MKKLYSGLNSKVGIFNVAFLVFWTAALFITLNRVHSVYSKSVLDSTVAQIQQSFNAPNYDVITKNLTDLEALGFLKCPTLVSRDSGLVYSDSSLLDRCKGLGFFFVERIFVGKNGDRMRLTGKVTLPLAYQTIIFGIYLFGTFLFSIFIVFQRIQKNFKDRIRDQQNKQGGLKNLTQQTASCQKSHGGIEGTLQNDVPETICRR